MVKFMFIFSGHDSSYGMREACMELEEKHPGEFCFHFSDTFEMDGNAESFEKSMELCGDADFIFISIHGGITYFKGFDRLFGAYAGKKKFFIYSGVEEENVLLLKKSGISGNEYDEILRYFLMGGRKTTPICCFISPPLSAGPTMNMPAPKLRAGRGYTIRKKTRRIIRNTCGT
jgi:hypothetical protein